MVLGLIGPVHFVGGVGGNRNVGQPEGGHLDGRGRWILHLPADTTAAAPERQACFGRARQSAGPAGDASCPCGWGPDAASCAGYRIPIDLVLSGADGANGSALPSVYLSIRNADFH